MVQNEKKICLSRSISQEPYIISLLFMIHLCKKIISPSILSIFSKFWFSGLLGGRVKGQKLVQNDKKILSVALHISGSIITWSSFMVHMCKRIISPGIFYIFFQSLSFGVNSGVKGQKVAQNAKKLCLSHSISQEAYIIWSRFLVHMCKIMTSPDAFFIFSKVWFSELLWK